MTRLPIGAALLVVTAALLVPACRGTHPPPQFAWDKTADFADLKTFAWDDDPGYPMPHGDSIIDGQFIDRNVRSAVDESLEKKGYRQADPARASFFVAYFTGDTAVTDQVKDPNYAWLTGYETDMYEKSRMITIDIRDASKKLVWRGSITRLEGENPSAVGREIHSEIGTLLDKFPPTAAN